MSRVGRTRSRILEGLIGALGVSKSQVGASRALDGSGLFDSKGFL